MRNTDRSETALKSMDQFSELDKLEKVILLTLYKHQPKSLNEEELIFEIEKSGLLDMSDIELEEIRCKLISIKLTLDANRN